MKNLTSYIGLMIIVLAAIFMLVIYATGNTSNTMLAIAGGLGIIGLLVQIFVGRSVDY